MKKCTICKKAEISNKSKYCHTCQFDVILYRANEKYAMGADKRNMAKCIKLYKGLSEEYRLRFMNEVE